MRNPYIEAYENENGDIVLLYVNKVCIGESVEPDFLIIDPEHADHIASEIVKAKNNIMS